LRIVLALGAGLAFSLLAPNSQAQTAGIAGKYQCAQVKVHGSQALLAQRTYAQE